METNAVKDPRDIIWEKVYIVYYESYWVEILADKAIKIWEVLDEITKVLVAITASSSAVAGWVLWKQDEFKYIWAILAGIAALFSIVHAALSVANRIKDWTETKRLFSILRIDLEKCRDKMEINRNFDVGEYLNHYEAFKDKYGSLYPNIKNDILRTKRLEIKAQRELNSRIENFILKSENEISNG